MQEPRNGSKKAALHLLEMTERKFSMLSLPHSFKKGQITTATFDENGKPKLIDFDLSSSSRMQAPIYQHDHLYISEILENGWNGHFYTEDVSPAVLIGLSLRID